MKVLILADTEPSWRTPAHLQWAFESLGHSTTTITEARGLTAIEQVASDCDLVLYSKTKGLPREATAMWRRLESRGVVTASHTLDLWRGLPREQEIIDGDPLWTTQHVFSADGDPESAAWFAEHGVNHHWLRPAMHAPDASLPQTNGGPDVEPIVFVGSWRSYHPAWPQRLALIEWAKSRYGAEFGCYPKEGAPRLHGQALLHVYQRATVVLGDSLCPPGHRNYWSDRPYEVVGRGGFLLMPEVPGLEQDFTTAEHLAFFDRNKWDVLADEIDCSLGDPEAAQFIADQGRSHVLANHTYTHRVSEMLDVLMSAHPRLGKEAITRLVPSDPIRLNIGGGADRMAGFLTVDLRADVADVVAPADDLAMFGDGSVEEIAALDILEHVWRDKAGDLLGEWHRVLRYDGKLTVRVPNLAVLAKQIVDGVRVEDTIRNIYGGHRYGPDGAWDAHHYGYVPESLAAVLTKWGFDVESNDGRANMTVVAYKR